MTDNYQVQFRTSHSRWYSFGPERISFPKGTVNPRSEWLESVKRQHKNTGIKWRMVLDCGKSAE